MNPYLVWDLLFVFEVRLSRSCFFFLKLQLGGLIYLEGIKHSYFSIFLPWISYLKTVFSLIPLPQPSPYSHNLLSLGSPEYKEYGFYSLANMGFNFASSTVLGCCNKLSQTGWLYATEMSFLTVLEVRVWNQGIGQAARPPEVLWGNPSLPLLLWGLLTFLGSWLHLSLLCIQFTFSSVCVMSNLSLLLTYMDSCDSI